MKDLGWICTRHQWLFLFRQTSLLGWFDRYPTPNFRHRYEWWKKTSKRWIWFFRILSLPAARIFCCKMCRFPPCNILQEWRVNIVNSPRLPPSRLSGNVGRDTRTIQNGKTVTPFLEWNGWSQLMRIQLGAHLIVGIFAFSCHWVCRVAVCDDGWSSGWNGEAETLRLHSYFKGFEIFTFQWALVGGWTSWVLLHLVSCCPASRHSCWWILPGYHPETFTHLSFFPCRLNCQEVVKPERMVLEEDFQVLNRWSVDGRHPSSGVG